MVDVFLNLHHCSMTVLRLWHQLLSSGSYTCTGGRIFQCCVVVIIFITIIFTIISINLMNYLLASGTSLRQRHLHQELVTCLRRIRLNCWSSEDIDRSKSWVELMVQNYSLLLVLGSVEQFSILVFTHHLGPTSVTVFLSSLASSQPRADRESCRISLICFLISWHKGF